MAVERSPSAIHPVGRLLAGESVVAQSERQLLDRFVTDRDELAFEAIVARHGPMVVGVCRSILDQSTDIDDAFQATFLVLVRKAKSIRDRDQLSPWLHGVARRVALRARIVAARRRGREIGHPDLVASAPDRPIRSAEAREQAALLHAEIDRLTLTERAAILLCDLQGLTHQEAADQLGWPLGTVKTRVNRGRDRLRVRLARRGVTLAAAGITASLAVEAVAAVVVARTLVVVTTRSALAVMAGRSLTVGLVTSPVYCLTQGTLRTMIFTKLKVMALGLAVSAAAVAVPAVVAYQAQPDGQSGMIPPDVKTAPATKPSRPDPGQQVDPRFNQETRVDKREVLSETIETPISPQAGLLKPDDSNILHKLEKPHPFGPPGQVPVHRVQPTMSFQDFRSLVQRATIDPQGGLPDGIFIDLTSDAATLTRTCEIQLANLDNQAPTTPLRVVLAKLIRPLGLEYRVSGGRLLLEKTGDPNAIKIGGVKASHVRSRELEDEDRNEKIEVKLDQMIALDYPEGVILSEFLDKISKSLGIPIYLDPKSKAHRVEPVHPDAVFREGPTSITLSLEGVPVRIALRLALRQLDMDYKVAGGVLIVSDSRDINRLSDLSSPDDGMANFH